MADAFIGIDEPTTIDKKADTEELTVGVNQVHRERVQIAGSAAVEIAIPRNSDPVGTEYALPVRNIPSGTQPVSAASLPLPTGAATSALQLPAGHTVDVTDEPGRDLGKVDVASLDQYTPIAGRLPVDPSGVTSPVSIAATVLVDNAVGVSVAIDDNAGSITVDAPVGTPLRVDPTGTTTQPVSAAALPLPTGAATAANQLPAGHTVDVTDRALRDCGKIDIASLDQYTPIAGRLPVDGSGATQPVSLAQNLGKTITRFVLAQGAAGTTVIAAASPGNRHKIVKVVFSLSAVGTAKFTDGAGDLTGAMDFATRGGVVLPSDANQPWLETAVNSALNIVTTGGSARGLVVFVTEP